MTYRVDVAEKAQVDALEYAEYTAYARVQAEEILEFLREAGAPEDLVSYAEDELSMKGDFAADSMGDLCRAIGIEPKTWTDKGVNYVDMPCLCEFQVFDSKTGEEWDSIFEYQDSRPKSNTTEATP